MVVSLALTILHLTNISNQSYKILRLHAILHEASGFVFEHSEKGPCYSYVLPHPVTNEYLGHVSGIAFSLYVKTFNFSISASYVGSTGKVAVVGVGATRESIKFHSFAETTFLNAFFAAPFLFRGKLFKNQALLTAPFGEAEKCIFVFVK